MTNLLVYTSTPTNRVRYISSIINDALGIDNVELSSDINLFSAHEGAKLNYSTTQISEDECWIYPANLLFETTIREQVVDCFQYKASKAFFRTTSGDFPFDVFAASFYLISRYEEYLPHKLDEYGRYAHTNSIAFKENFLHVPIINLWLQELLVLLLQKFPSLQFKQQQFQFIPTYDIDIAWSYYGKGMMRNAGGFIKSILKGDWQLFTERIYFLLGNLDDPFDIYDWLDKLHDDHELKPVYFFLLARKAGKYDKNINPRTRDFKLLISKLAAVYKTGIHPSWQSGDDESLLLKEIETLRSITNKPVKSSRQHYIRMSLPQTYNQLISAGIENDYSMGYGSINGFRASYCLPYKWYDLSKEEITPFTIHPFCYMEANSLFEEHYTPQQALDELKHYYQITKKVKGTLITIFHNHLLTEQPKHIAWRGMYRTWLEGLKGLDEK